MSEYLYQKTQQYFGQLAGGAESCGEDELKKLGASKIRKGYLGFYFCADPDTIYNIVYKTRIFSRILAPLMASAAEPATASGK